MSGSLWTRLIVGTNVVVVRVAARLWTVGILSESLAAGVIERRASAIETPPRLPSGRRIGRFAAKTVAALTALWLIYLGASCAYGIAVPRCTNLAFAPIVASLRDRPGEWSKIPASSDYVTNASGVRVWAGYTDLFTGAWVTIDVPLPPEPGTEETRETTIKSDDIPRACRAQLKTYAERVIANEDAKAARRAEALATQAVR